MLIRLKKLNKEINVKVIYKLITLKVEIKRKKRITIIK